jgi:hypothetical protein
MPTNCHYGARGIAPRLFLPIAPILGAPVYGPDSIKTQPERDGSNEAKRGEIVSRQFGVTRCDAPVTALDDVRPL